MFGKFSQPGRRNACRAVLFGRGEALRGSGRKLLLACWGVDRGCLLAFVSRHPAAHVPSGGGRVAVYLLPGVNQLAEYRPARGNPSLGGKLVEFLALECSEASFLPVFSPVFRRITAQSALFTLWAVRAFGIPHFQEAYFLTNSGIRRGKASVQNNSRI